MILLVIAAVIAAFALIANSWGALNRVSPTDNSDGGPWGVVSAHFARNRLPPNARRWRTAIISAGVDETRWRDLTQTIGSLEAAVGLAPDAPYPAELDPDWLDTRIDRLEQALEERVGDPT